MSYAHSPGPWHWKAMPGCAELHSAEHDMFCIQEEHNGFYDPRCPDAELIRAAPEMAALLRELADAIEACDRGEPDLADRARALLASLPPAPEKP